MNKYLLKVSYHCRLGNKREIIYTTASRQVPRNVSSLGFLGPEEDSTLRENDRTPCISRTPASVSDQVLEKRNGIRCENRLLVFFPVFASHSFAGTIHAEVWPVRSASPASRQLVRILLQVQRKRGHALFATQHLAREALPPTRRDLAHCFRAPCGYGWCASWLSPRQRGASRSQAVAVRRPPDTHGSTHDAAEHVNAGIPAQAEKIIRQIDPMGAPEPPRGV